MVIDAGSVSALVSSLDTVTKIAQAMIGLRDASLIRDKVIELQGEILSAQSAALAANAHQGTLLERLRQLEKEVADLKAWEGEKQRYELKEVFFGAFVYALKPAEAIAEPMHWICTACYQHGRKSLLQQGKRVAGDSRHKTFDCPECKSSIITYHTTYVSAPKTKIADSDQPP